MAREHSVSDYFSLMNLSGITLDGEGRKAAIAVSRTYHEKKQPNESSVIVYSLPGGEQIARYEEKNTRKSGPRFDESGTRLAFLELVSERNYLVINDLSESVSERIELDGQPHQIEWAGSSILILKDEPVDPELKKKHDDGQDGTFFEEEARYSSLYLYRPGSGFKQLTRKLQVWEFSGNSQRVALVASATPHEQSWYHARLYELDTATGSTRMLYDPKWRSIARPRLSPDGTKILFTESLWSDRGLTTGDLLLYSYSDGSTRNLTEGQKRSYADALWTGRDTYSVLWTMEGTYGISEFKGSWKDLWQARGTVLPAFAPEFAHSGGMYAFSFTDETNPPELYTLSSSAEFRKASSFNSSLSDLRSYPAEVVKWKSKDGMEIHGIFRSLGKDAPVIVNVHGGPTSASSISFMDRSTIMLGQGFSVFMPNYRGSTGSGRDYAEANRGDMGGKDFEDILSGIEYLRASGKVSTDNIFITGGSYGGFMTSWAVTRTDIFKAAVGLFGITDWYSFHGTSNLSDWDQTHYDDDPYKGVLYSKFSPMKYIHNVKTPILLMHGINDPYVPVGQYYQFYRGLKDLGKTVRLLLFPREGHGFTERSHIEQYAEETVKWFRKYMN